MLSFTFYVHHLFGYLLTLMINSFAESCGQHGRCAEPDVCRCDPGFSGEKCNEVGCPGAFVVLL